RLSSTRATETTNGVVSRNYYPFGEEIGTPSLNDAQKFADTYRDSTTGLDYAINRYYSSGIGRFLRVDPYKGSGKTSNPGSWNRYSYVGNDPSNSADPTGLDPTITYCNVYPGDPHCSPYPQAPPPVAPGGGAPQPRPLDEQFADRYGVSIECARGLFDAGGRPRDVSGFAALWAMVERAKEHETTLRLVAEPMGLDWSILAGIGIRETGFRNISQPDGLGRGIFQSNRLPHLNIPR
ncbi:MAG: RHS repeat-associated core domain-containing protein, partial [bacterium]